MAKGIGALVETKSEMSTGSSARAPRTNPALCMHASLKIDSDDPKLRLFEAGVRLISEKGYNATSIADICDEANINRGSFYYYIKDKMTFARSAT